MALSGVTEALMGPNGGDLAVIECYLKVAKEDTLRENQNRRGENVGC